MAKANVAQYRAPADGTTNSELEHIRAVRDALLIGLECFGEVERLIDLHETLVKIGQAPDMDLKPLHPTGASDTIGLFASALRLLGNMEEQHV